MGVAAALRGERLESAVLINLVQQYRSTLLAEWVVTREAEMDQLDGEGTCWNTYRRLVEILNEQDGRCDECQTRKTARCKISYLTRCGQSLNGNGEYEVCQTGPDESSLAMSMVARPRHELRSPP